MGLTSKTGLVPSPIKKLVGIKQPDTPRLKPMAKPVTFVLKPFSGLYNPYPYGCSLLCNHPTDYEAKELLKKARDTWAYEGKNLLLSEEINAIKASLEHLRTEESHTSRLEVPMDSVPEELFRRYTETDSRPLTPAPTITSAHTRASGSRRCVTPDPMPTAEVREKTMLILDLRRSHSQETLSWYGSSSQDLPLIKIQQAPTRSVTPFTGASGVQTPRIHSRRGSRNLVLGTTKSPKMVVNADNRGDTKEKASEKARIEDRDFEEEEEEEGYVKRRGKRRKKRGRDLSGGPASFQTPTDPETQVGTISAESHNPSTRPSLVPQESAEESQKKPGNRRSSGMLDHKTYLDPEILKHLRRELNEEIIENEFNLKRRKALEEAMKTVNANRADCDELITLRKELNVPPVSTDLWLKLPRVFSRSSARFELPMDSRTLSTLTPLEYIRSNVSITSPRKLLYNCIFNQFKIDDELNIGSERKIAAKVISQALNLMMGRDLTEKQMAHFKELVGWSEDEAMDYRTFCSLCALCERLIGPEYCPQSTSRKTDPCHEIETADFESLNRRLEGQEVDERLVKILYAIKNS